jgi:hypothetical protein
MAPTRSWAIKIKYDPTEEASEADWPLTRDDPGHLRTPSWRAAIVGCRAPPRAIYVSGAFCAISGLRRSQAPQANSAAGDRFNGSAPWQTATPDGGAFDAALCTVEPNCHTIIASADRLIIAAVPFGNRGRPTRFSPYGGRRRLSTPHNQATATSAPTVRTVNGSGRRSSSRRSQRTVSATCSSVARRSATGATATDGRRGFPVRAGGRQRRPALCALQEFWGRVPAPGEHEPGARDRRPVRQAAALTDSSAPSTA